MQKLARGLGGVGLAAVLVCTSGAVATPSVAPRVILLSWDGAAYWMTSRLLSQGRLPNLQRIVREGAWSDGMVTSFSSKTAPGHAALWTGLYGHDNGVTGNAILVKPLADHTVLEARSAFFSDALEAEPLWVMTARAGRKTFTFHATHSYPFGKHLEALGRAERPYLQMLHGYARHGVPAEVLTEKRVRIRPAEGWSLREAVEGQARQFRFTVGEQAFWALFFDDPFDPTKGCDTLGVAGDRRDGAFLARVKPGASGAFSVPIEAHLRGRGLWYALRLFELDPAARRFLLYRSSAEPVALSSEAFPGAGSVGVEAFAGNGASSAYRHGDLGLPLPAGGSGEAEQRLLETLGHLTSQLRRQVEPLFASGDYGLVVMYSPVVDEVAHCLTGYVDPALDGYDPALAEKLWPILARAFEMQDALLAWVVEKAARDGGHLLLVSDHGMAGTNRRFHVNVALERAGLLTLTPKRKIDLAATRALMPPLADPSIVINTTEHKGGIVRPEARTHVLEEVRKALEHLVDPETGLRIVTGLFGPSRKGLLQPGRSTTGDLFLDLAPGYTFSASTEVDELVTSMPPVGNHGFVPTRRDMLAIFAAWGPRVPRGLRLQRVRAIDVAPTVLDLLGVEGPSRLPGRSLIPEETLLETWTKKQK